MNSNMRFYSGQLNIQNSAVLIVGCGGLGCPIAQYLSAAGIGKCVYEISHNYYQSNTQDTWD